MQSGNSRSLTWNEDQFLFEDIDGLLLLVRPLFHSLNAFVDKRCVEMGGKYVDVRGVNVSRHPSRIEDRKRLSVIAHARLLRFNVREKHKQ